MKVSSRQRSVIQSNAPALTVLTALRWVAVIFGCSRRERARRFLALVLPQESHLEGQNSKARS
jgi:hypothetical protein